MAQRVAVQSLGRRLSWPRKEPPEGAASGSRPLEVLSLYLRRGAVAVITQIAAAIPLRALSAAGSGKPVKGCQRASDCFRRL